MTGKDWLAGVAVAFIGLCPPTATAEQLLRALQEPAKLGVRGRIRLVKTVPFPEPIKLALISKNFDNQNARLVVTESNKVLAASRSGKYREIFRPAQASNKVFAMPDAFGRSLGVSDDGPGGAFYLFNAAGKTLARISELNGYRHVFSEPEGPLIVTRPTGGWPGWPSIWKADGTRSEKAAEGWPEGHAVRTVKFSPDGKTLAVLSHQVPSYSEFTLSAYSSTGTLIGRASTPSESDWTTAAVTFSKSGRAIVVASRTRVRTYDLGLRITSDTALRSNGEPFIRLSGDEKRVVVAASSSVALIDVSEQAVKWAWNLQELQDTGAVPPGNTNISRVDCSADGKTILISGMVWSWQQDRTLQGEASRKQVVHTEFVAILQDGRLFDVLKLPAESLLQDLSESISGAAQSVALSETGDRMIVPLSQAIFYYAVPR